MISISFIFFTSNNNENIQKDSNKREESNSIENNIEKIKIDTLEKANRFNQSISLLLKVTPAHINNYENFTLLEKNLRQLKSNEKNDLLSISNKKLIEEREVLFDKYKDVLTKKASVYIKIVILKNKVYKVEKIAFSGKLCKEPKSWKCTVENGDDIRIVLKSEGFSLTNKAIVIEKDNLIDENILIGLSNNEMIDESIKNGYRVTIERDKYE